MYRKFLVHALRYIAQLSKMVYVEILVFRANLKTTNK